MAGADRLTNLAEGNIYADEVIFSRTTPYQRIVLTAWRDDLRLFLNSHLQFSSRDEYRYHEALVHPAMAVAPGPRRGCSCWAAATASPCARSSSTRGSSTSRSSISTRRSSASSRRTQELRRLNHDAFLDPRVHVVNADAFPWLDEGTDLFDVAFVDFPDPSNFSVGKLYTTTFYRRLLRRLSPDALFVVQSTSPLFARQAYWCVVETVRAVGRARLALPRVRAVVRRMGLRARRTRRLEPADAVPGRPALSHSLARPGRCSSSRPTWARSPPTSTG